MKNIFSVFFTTLKKSYERFLGCLRNFSCLQIVYQEEIFFWIVCFYNLLRKIVRSRNYQVELCLYNWQREFPCMHFISFNVQQWMYIVHSPVIIIIIIKQLYFCEHIFLSNWQRLFRKLFFFSCNIFLLQ